MLHTCIGFPCTGTHGEYGVIVVLVECVQYEYSTVYTSSLANQTHYYKMSNGIFSSTILLFECFNTTTNTTNMQTHDPSELHTTFYDRLSLVERIRYDGQHEQVGGDEGGVKVRIIKNSTSTMPILTLHLASTLVASAAIQKFDITHISMDGYAIHIYLNEYGVHKVRRKYILHFSNDQIAAKKFVDAYISVLSTDTQSKYPSYFDLVEEAEFKEVEKCTTEANDVDYDGSGSDDKDDGNIDEDLKCDDGDSDERNHKKESSSLESNLDELNLDDGFLEQSQDVYADNCLITLAKKWG